MRISSFFLAVALAALTGCSSARQSAKKDGPVEEKVEGPKADPMVPSRAAQEKVTEYDLNHDKKADVWAYTVISAGADGKDIAKLVRKELDINWDSKVDITRVYDEKEQLQQERLDLDFDGKVDQINFYEKGAVIRKERDLDYNQKADLWIFYEKGKIARKERDTNSDGKVDYWEFWEGEQVDRVGEDLDGDGNVDRWTKNPNSEQ